MFHFPKIVCTSVLILVLVAQTIEDEELVPQDRVNESLSTQ